MQNVTRKVNRKRLQRLWISLKSCCHSFESCYETWTHSQCRCKRYVLSLKGFVCGFKVVWTQRWAPCRVRIGDVGGGGGWKSYLDWRSVLLRNVVVFLWFNCQCNFLFYQCTLCFIVAPWLWIVDIIRMCLVVLCRYDSRHAMRCSKGTRKIMQIFI